MQIGGDQGQGKGNDGAVEIVQVAGGEQQAGDGPGPGGRDKARCRQIPILTYGRRREAFRERPPARRATIPHS